MQQHTVQQITAGPNEGKYVYTGGNRRMGRYPQCCPDFTSESSGHATAEEAYAHMRASLLERLELEAFTSSDWAGCRAPVGEGRCDVPTKGRAVINPMYFNKALCDEHRTRETVEAMWQGPGDWSGSW